MLPQPATLIVALVLLTSTLTARADKIDDYVKAQMDAFHLPGLSLVVIKDGKIVKSAGYGLANVGKKVPATPETVYKIGSVSKQFIATGVMFLSRTAASASTIRSASSSATLRPPGRRSPFDIS